MRYYAFKICPGFWEALSEFMERGKVISIKAVKGELTPEGDQSMEKWLKKETTQAAFVSTDTPEANRILNEINSWVANNDQYKPQAKEKFITGADPKLIAYACANTMTLVTSEKSATKSTRSIKIPDVCNNFGVSYCNTFDMLKDIGVSFTYKT